MKQELVAIFCTSHSDSVGNSCRIQLLKEFSYKFHLTVVTNQVEYFNSLGFNCEVLKLPVCNSKLMRIPVLSKLVYAKFLANFLNRICNHKKLFVFHDTSDFVLFVDRSIPVYTCVHQIHEFIGLGQKRGLSKLFTILNGRILLQGVKRSTACFANFETIAEFLKNHGVNQEVIVTPHFVDLKTYDLCEKVGEISNHLNFLKSQSKFILTYTGWVSENRGLALMLEMIKRLASFDSRYILCIVGCQQDYIEKINLFAKTNNMQDNVCVYGRISYDYMPAILKVSHMCLSFLEINPVYSVSPPQKVVEYFASGKPVIANHIKTHDCLISDGYNGFLLDSVDEIVDKVRIVANDKDLYKTLSANALQSAQRFDKNNIIEDYYNHICK